MINLHISHEVWPLKEPFRISRGVKTEAHVIKVELEHYEIRGRGEAAPYARYGETIDSVLAQLEEVRDTIEDGISPEDLLSLLPAGAARNAVDSALWDLTARWRGKHVSQLLGLPRPTGYVETAVTIGIGSVEDTANKARAYKNLPLLKVKLDRENIKDKIAAIRAEAPKPRIIIDPNESWTVADLGELDDFLLQMKIDLLEQPLAAGEDDGLKDFKGSIPLCADESCHTRKELDGLVGKYQFVNIKLDKSGGLTEALKLKEKAQSMGFGIMVGCMVSTSLAMAPAMLLAPGAEFIDLDGPIWMKQDREEGLRINQGLIDQPSKKLWGG